MRVALLALFLFPVLAFASASGHAPAGTFTDTFLVVSEDVRDAARAGKRLILFFEQEGCPACLKMAQTTFPDREVAKTLQRGFVMVAIDLNGARETTWLDGRARPEKELAKHLDIRATPTVLILDPHGKVVQRFVGYRDPAAFRAILEAAAQK